MEKVEAFKANNGKLFSSEEEAIAYEHSLVWTKKIAAYVKSADFPYEKGSTAAGMCPKIILGLEKFKSLA